MKNLRTWHGWHIYADATLEVLSMSIARTFVRARVLLLVLAALAGSASWLAAQDSNSDFVHDNMVTALAFSPDGEYLACGGWDGTVSLWRIDEEGYATGIGRIDPYEGMITALAFSPTNSWLAVTGPSGGIAVLDLEKRWKLHSFGSSTPSSSFAPSWGSSSTYARHATSLAFSADDELLFAAGPSGVYAWRLSDGHLLSTLCEITYCPNGNIGAGSYSLAVLPPGQGALVANVGGRSLDLFVDSPPRWAVMQPDVEWDRSKSWSLGEEDIWWSLDVGPLGDVVALGSHWGNIALWGYGEDGLEEQIRLLEGHEARVESLAFSESAEQLLSGSWDQTVRLWDVRNGQLLSSYHEEGDAVYCIGDFSPRGGLAALTTATCRVIIVRIEDGEIFSSIHHRDDLPVLAFEQADPQHAHRLWSSASADIAYGASQESTAWDLEYARDIYRRIGDTQGEATCLKDLGTCWYQLEQYENASQAYSESLDLFMGLGDASNADFCASGLLSACLRIPLIERSVSLAKMLSDRVSALERAADQLESTGQLLPAARTWNYLGAWYDYLDRHDDAIASYRQAAEYFSASEEFQLAADAMVSACDAHQDVNERIACLELALAESRGGGELETEARVLKLLGLACSAAERTLDAVRWYDAAANAYHELDDVEHEASVINHAGLELMDQELYREAIGYLESAAGLYERIEKKSWTLEREAWNLMDLADCYAALEQFTQAIAINEEVLVLARQASGIINLTVRPFWGIGRCYWQIGEMEQALEHYDRAILEAEAYAGEEEREAFRQTLQTVSFRRLYEEYVELLLLLGLTEEALLASERCHARTFLDLLATGPMGSWQDVEEEGIRTGVVDARAIEGGLASMIDRLPEDTAAVEYFVTDKATHVWIATQGSVSCTVQLPVDRAALLDQVIVCREAIEARDPVADFHLAALYDSLVAPIEAYLPPSNDGDSIPHLVIIPSGPLYYLPFQALLSTSARSQRTRLIERYAISYAPSLATLDYAQQRVVTTDTTSLVALADPASGDSLLGRLPEAQTESQRVAALFPAAEVYVDTDATETIVQSRSSVASDLLFSTHGTFNAVNPMYSYLLLSPTDATDGRLHTFEVFGLPLSANLVVLSACETLFPAIAEMEDREREKRGMAADAPVELTLEQLQTLTAGDEIAGLTRAFLYAGASSVLSSLWSVHSQATADLMVTLYESIQAGRGKAEALRSAMLELLDTPGYNHPAYWAAFNLMGDWR